MARDLDFCRDEDLLPLQGAEVARPWKCGFCAAEYNRLEIEERLISMVERVVTEWNTQDLKCGRCGGVRVNDFMEHCSCSGQWVETVKMEEVVKRMRVFKNVAAGYGLRMLGVVVGEVLDGL